MTIPISVKQTYRRLAKSPCFLAVSLATFAICVGSNAVILSIIYAVLVKPLPYPHASELVVVTDSYPQLGSNRVGASVPNYYDFKAGVPAFAEIAAYSAKNVVVGDSDNAQRVFSQVVTPSFFRLLDVSAARGRVFSEDEGVPGRNSVVVLSHDFWKNNFAGSSTAIGRTLMIDGAPATVVGVLPEKFSFPGVEPSVWQPLAFRAEERTARHSIGIQLIARLKPGISPGEAQAEINLVNSRTEILDPYREVVQKAGYRTDVLEFRANVIQQIRPMLLLLQLAAISLLIIGVINLINIFIARASARMKDQAVCHAFGCSNKRMAFQSVAEAVCLAEVGGGIGLWAGASVLRLLAHAGVIGKIPLGTYVAVDAPVAAVLLGVCALIGLLLGLIACPLGFRRDLWPLLQVESRGGTTAKSTSQFRTCLIVAQISLAFTLLATASSLSLSFKRVISIYPGFNAEKVLTGAMSLTSKTYQDNLTRFKVAQRLADSLQLQPEFTAAGLSTSLPTTGTTSSQTIWLPGSAAQAANNALHQHYVYSVYGDYFTALGLPLLSGRFLNSSDSTRKENVCVVDADVARQYWPPGDAIGRQIAFGVPGKNSAPKYAVVGVVGPVKQMDLVDGTGKGVIYLPFFPVTQEPSFPGTPTDFRVIARTIQTPEAAVASLRQAISRAVPGVPLDNVRTMDDWLQESVFNRRFALYLTVFFAGTALILAALGVYGVLAYVVSQRQREIGIRIALGADPSRILKSFLSYAVKIFIAGAVPGLAGAWLAGRLMGALLYHSSPLNIPVLVTTTLVLGGLVLFASSLPSRRAARISPLDALRD